MCVSVNRFIVQCSQCVSVNGFIFHVNTQWKINRFIWFIIHFIDSMVLFIHVNRFTVASVPVKHILMTRHMTSLCPSNGAVNRFTRTHGREREPWTDSRGSRDLKVVNGVKDHSRKHTFERVHVNEFTDELKWSFFLYQNSILKLNQALGRKIYAGTYI